MLDPAILDVAVRANGETDIDCSIHFAVAQHL
jgi:hypothetical protein